MTILAAIDLSPLTDTVVKETSTLARALGAPIVLAHIVRSEVAPDAVQAPQAMEHHVDEIEAIARTLRGEGHTVEVACRHSKDAPAAALLAEVARRQPRYVVVGSHGRSKTYELFIGSTTRALVNEATAPVVVVNGLRSVGGPG